MKNSEAKYQALGEWAHRAVFTRNIVKEDIWVQDEKASTRYECK